MFQWLSKEDLSSEATANLNIQEISELWEKRKRVVMVMMVMMMLSVMITMVMMVLLMLMLMLDAEDMTVVVVGGTVTPKLLFPVPVFRQLGPPSH